MLTRDQNAYLETKLALHAVVRPEEFPAVHKVSNVILKLIAEEGIKIRAILSDEDKFKALINEFYRTADRGALGAVMKTKSTPSVEDVLQDIQKTLTDPNATLMDIMPIHSVFGYRIAQLLFKESYGKIRENLNKKTQEIFAVKKFVEKRADDKDIIPTTQLGISDSEKVWAKIKALPEVDILGKKIEVNHRNSLQRFKIQTEAEAFSQYRKNNLPQAAGPSTHTVVLFAAADSYAETYSELFQLSLAERKEYGFAYGCYHTTSGYHTVHEVMQVVTACLNQDQDQKSYSFDYLENMPPQFREVFAKWVAEVQNEAQLEAISSPLEIKEAQDAKSSSPTEVKEEVQPEKKGSLQGASIRFGYSAGSVTPPPTNSEELRTNTGSRMRN